MGGSSRRMDLTEVQAPPAAPAPSPAVLSDDQKFAIQEAVLQKKNRYKDMNIKGIRKHGLTKGQLMMDRHSRMAKGSGTAKKGGGGGKFTWGSAFINREECDGVLDDGDPNYDSMEDGGATAGEPAFGDRVRGFKGFVTECVQEYFDAGEIAEVSELLSECAMPRLMHHFVKRAVVMSMDRHDREREMVSVLLSALYGDVLAADDVEKGFLSLVKTIDDTALDVPGAPAMLAKFIARAVVDEILPPSAVQQLFAAAPSPQAEACVNEADTLLQGRHAAEQVLRCWGSGAGMTLAETRQSITALLDEYQTSLDVSEATRRLRELAVPFFHHELVRRAVQRCLGNAGAAGAMAGLLRELHGMGMVSDTQMLKGFQREAECLDDESIDVPGAKESFQKLVEDARDQGWLDPHFSLEAAMVEARASAVEIDPTEQSYKRRCEVVVREYFDSDDAAEVGRCLEEMSDVSMRHLFVKRLLTVAMDHKPRECEMSSRLLASLYPATLPQAAIMGGFEAAIDAAEDLSLDCPDASHLLGLFLARAVVDDVLPPAFLQSVLHMLPDGCLGVDIVHSAAALLSQRNAALKLESCWVGSAVADGESEGAAEGAGVGAGGNGRGDAGGDGTAVAA